MGQTITFYYEKEPDYLLTAILFPNVSEVSKAISIPDNTPDEELPKIILSSIEYKPDRKKCKLQKKNNRML